MLAALACLAATAAPAASTNGPVGYVGSEDCTECHAGQTAAWQRSDHFKSMQRPSPESVAGDFADARVAFHGIETFFRSDGDGYIVDTIGRSGARAALPVRYVFGYRPLQQYLVARDDGVLQAFDVAWDNRSREAGGQRWYHLQPDEKITPGHPFFWTGHAMNWASHCADCHSTHVVSTFDAKSERFGADYAEINVACEACHGPAGEHVRLARSGALADAQRAGFSLSSGPRLEWRFQPGNPIAQPHGAREERAPQPSPSAPPAARPRSSPMSDIDMCGGCHSLRTPLTADPAGKPYHEAYRLELLNDVRYFPDGQIREEVYVLGSFLQSRMHVRGVTCVNCHDPHSGALVADGNAVCAQCHQADVYDTATHHRHTPGTAGSRCVDCHMPSRTYMGVDDRRDHSFPIPRPDLSAELGVPNACVDCHRERDNAWAAAALRDWDVAHDSSHWSRVYRDLRRGDPGAAAALTATLEDPELSALVRASLMAQASNLPSGDAARLLPRWLADADPLVRRGAIGGTLGLGGGTRWALLAELLKDSHPGVRFELGIALSDVHRDMPPAAAEAAGEVYADYRRALSASAYLAASQNALARLDQRLGQPRGAEQGLERALRLDPTSLPALVELADLRRSQGREADAGALLARALAAYPESAVVNVAFALHLVRTQRHEEALAPLSRALDGPDAEPGFAYIHAVALDSMGQRNEAIDALRRALERWPWDFNLLATLVLYIDDGALPEVQQYLHRLSRIAPDSPQARALQRRYGSDSPR